jgi:hypothetical protein
VSPLWAIGRTTLEANGHRSPIVLVSEQEDWESGDAAVVTDWLIKPFTGAYARTKIRAWVLRTACHWIPSGAPANEERQLASPLVTRNQFDRITGPQHERRRSPKRVANSDKSALLWMYGRKIAPFIDMDLIWRARWRCAPGVAYMLSRGRRSMC